MGGRRAPPLPLVPRLRRVLLGAHAAEHALGAAVGARCPHGKSLLPHGVDGESTRPAIPEVGRWRRRTGGPGAAPLAALPPLRERVDAGLPLRTPTARDRLSSGPGTGVGSFK